MHSTVPLDTEGQELMRGIDVDNIHARDRRVVLLVLERQRRHEPSKFEVEAVDLITRRREVRVAGGEVVRQRSPEPRYSRAVVEAALGVELDRAVVL